MARNAGKETAELIALGVFHLAAPHGRRHFVRFVADDQIPIGDLELFLQIRISGELIQAGKAEIHFCKYIAGYL